MSSFLGQRWHRRMVARDRDEPHRAATPLELLFDLCFVVAVAQVAAQFHHGLAEGHTAEALLGYVLVFFGIWWAWMNFTWFASAYDNDDVPYRLLTQLQIAGVLVLAAGVPSAFNAYDFRIAVVGYVMMRVAMVAQWLRAARDYPPGRAVALRYAWGIGVLQIGWLARLALSGTAGVIGFVVLGLLELSVPIWAERAGQPTSWHPEHIAERYGLFTLIVLGECVLAATTAIQSAIAENGVSTSLLLIAVGGLMLIFGLWWSYFKTSVVEGLRTSMRASFTWGYGHVVVFAAIVALGTGLQLAAETTQPQTHLSDAGAAFAVAIPVAVYMVAVALLHGPLSPSPSAPLSTWSTMLCATAILGVAALAFAFALPVVILLMGVIVVALVTWHIVALYRR
jgi:low temperature requirement protein LtrA